MIKFCDMSINLPIKNNQYKAIEEFDHTILYYCESLGKYKIVDYKNGRETIYKVRDFEIKGV